MTSQPVLMTLVGPPASCVGHPEHERESKRDGQNQGAQLTGSLPASQYVPAHLGQFDDQSVQPAHRSSSGAVTLFVRRYQALNHGAELLASRSQQETARGWFSAYSDAVCAVAGRWTGKRPARPGLPALSQFETVQAASITARILITGSRTWTAVSTMRAELARWRQIYPDAVLVHGALPGEQT